MCKFTSHTPLREKKVWSHCIHQDVAMAETMLFVSLVPQAPPSFPSLAVRGELENKASSLSLWCSNHITMVFNKCQRLIIQPCSIIKFLGDNLSAGTWPDPFSLSVVCKTRLSSHFPRWNCLRQESKFNSIWSKSFLRANQDDFQFEKIKSANQVINQAHFLPITTGHKCLNRQVTHPGPL